MKRRIACLLAALLLFSCCGCAGNKDEADAPLQTQSPAETPDAPERGNLGEGEPTANAFDLLGLIIDDNGTERAYMTMYGFLHTAENLSYAAKVYRAAAGDGMLAAVKQAQEDGVDALLVFDPTGKSDAAVTLAANSGMHVGVPYYACAAQGLAVNTVADTAEYLDELARGLAERMTQRSLKSGRILVYGKDTLACYEAFSQSLAVSAPQFRVDAFNRTALDETAAVDELAAYLLYNRDIKGMYVVDSDAASVAIKARAQAQKIFKADGAPTPTPELPMQGATPEPTVNPALLTQIMITVFCNGLSDDNYGLFNDNDIYALCIEPCYEAAAEATMALDKLLRGDTVVPVSRINRPIVYGDTADKYKAIFDQMKALFNLA